MPIQGELKIDSSYFTESLRETDKGWQGLRNYRVNTIDTTKAIFADGVPKRGDKWGEARLDSIGLKVRERETFLIGGKDSGDGTGGWTRVQVLYETPTATPFRVPIDANSRWTEIVPSRGQYTQMKALERFQFDPTTGDVDFSRQEAPLFPIANGNGCQVDFGIVEARVYTFQALGTASSSLPHLTRLMRPSKINNATINLPPLYGDTTPLELKKGQVRYVSFESSIVGGNGTVQLRQLVHVLELSEDFFFRWLAVDSSGNPDDNEALADRVYYYDDFTGLW